MSDIKVKEENIAGNENESWSEEMLDIKYNGIEEREFKQESNYGNLIYNH